MKSCGPLLQVFKTLQTGIILFREPGWNLASLKTSYGMSNGPRKHTGDDLHLLS